MFIGFGLSDFVCQGPITHIIKYSSLKTGSFCFVTLFMFFHQTIMLTSYKKN